VSVQKGAILVQGKAAAICPALRDFPSDPTPLRVETAGVVGYVEDFKRARTPTWTERGSFWMGT
jgi:hypothetical protein